MIVLPAIDLLGGKAVRLSRGDYGTAKTYSDEPQKVLRGFAVAGAKWAHIVDLDGAKAGKPINADVIEKLSEIMPIEIGGGIRTIDAAKEYLSRGAKRTIFGSAVARDFCLAERGAKELGDGFAVGVDARCGKVAVSGWTETTELDAYEFCRDLAAVGVRTIIYTDIDTDGMLSGTNLAAFAKLASLSTNIIASGGITTADEIRELSRLGIYGAIVGKAIYENKLSLESALEAANVG